MRILFLTNYYNHHQSALANELYRLCDEYLFIATKEMDEERRNMGWGQEQVPPYVVQYSAEPARCNAAIRDFDLVIFGDAPFSLIRQRVKSGKLVFVYSERILKRGLLHRWNLRILPRMMRQFLGRKNCFLLAASGYAAGDFNLIGCFRDRVLRWGYFPGYLPCDNIRNIIVQKQPASILWCARLIELKHPEVCIDLARRLKADGIPFHLDMIGAGAMEDTIREGIRKAGLEQDITMLGFMSPSQVLEHMRRSEIFLFTSNRMEGWGAVLNESMNAGCAVVSSSAVGSTLFLIQDGVNGMVYRYGDQEDLYQRVRTLLTDPSLRQAMGERAYHTIADEWNHIHAAQALMRVTRDLLDGKGLVFEPSGPCSKAERITMF